MADAAAKALLRLFAGTPVRTIARGTRLLTRGDAADRLFLVLSGRFEVVVDGIRRAEIGRGETIGEIAFFAGGRRTADVIAARDAEVLVLDADEFARRTSEAPDLLVALLRMMALRLDATTDRAAPPEPALPHNMVVVAAGDGPDPTDLFHRLAATGVVAGLRALKAGDVPPDVRGDRTALARFLDAQERRSARLLLLAERAEPLFAAQAIAQADAALLVAEAGGDTGVGPFEVDVARHLPPAARVLAIVRERGDRPIRGTAAWLADRPVARHHHLARDDPASTLRLARFLAGTATGLVLSGGGAFGVAHVGVVRALKERGIPIDAVGGTSVGAAIGVAVASGLSADAILERIDAIFVKGRAMARYTLPVFSLLDQRPFDRKLADTFRELRLEDLPIPAFAVSASLSDHEAVVIGQGRAFDAIRASAAIPGLLPPYPLGGHLHVDGAIVDNVPVVAMRVLKRGPNVVVAFAAESTGLPDYAGLPAGPALLGHLFRRARVAAGEPFPGIVGTLTRALMLTSRARLKALDIGDDLLIVPPVPADLGLLDWHRAGAIERIGYAEASARLDAIDLAPFLAHPARNGNIPLPG